MLCVRTNYRPDCQRSSGGIGERALLDICEEPEALAARLRDVQYVMEHSPTAFRRSSIAKHSLAGSPHILKCFIPTPSAHATFDTALVRDMAATILPQMRAMGILHALSPVLDVARTYAGAA